MRRLILVAAVFLSGCAAFQTDVDKAKDQLTLVETSAKLQAVKLQMCKDLVAHSIRCSANCELSAEWHKRAWNKKTDE